MSDFIAILLTTCFFVTLALSTYLEKLNRDTLKLYARLIELYEESEAIDKESIRLRDEHIETLEMHIKALQNFGR